MEAYFETIVHDAIVARRVQATEAAEHYLAGLLVDYAKGQQPRTDDAPLTFQLRDALESSGAERFSRLQQLGDGVLYLMGFFGASLPQRGADPDYIMKVGSSAYGHASAMLRGHEASSGPDVLAELSKKFDRFVGVLGEVADGALSVVRDDVSLLRLYERWQRTGSERLAQNLAGLGLCPMRGDGAVH
ncbi:MAG: hypothetical protein KC731_33240 [Myxococcales bacterium]|nr:hypothetical protein [Myxococcales bacterium]